MPVIPTPKVVLRKNSGTEAIRRRLNLIEGSGITITVSDDATNNEHDVTIGATAGTLASVAFAMAGGK